MRDASIGVLIAALLIVLACVFLEPLIVMWLWNVTVVTLFGWPTIGYWMAFGLTVLCHTLLNGWPTGGGSKKD